MSLSCYCDGDDAAWYYESPGDFSTLATKRRRKCCSCKATIMPGDTVAAFPRWRPTEHDIEERIYGEGGEVPISTWYMCETCGGLFFALDELGMCCDIGENLAAQIREFRAQEEYDRKFWAAAQSKATRS